MFVTCRNNVLIQPLPNIIGMLFLYTILISQATFHMGPVGSQLGKVGPSWAQLGYILECCLGSPEHLMILAHLSKFQTDQKGEDAEYPIYFAAYSRGTFIIIIRCFQHFPHAYII